MKTGTAASTLSGQLPVMELFCSIQGEGYHQGKAAAFIRLGGCDVGCVWCDVKDSWNAANHPLQSVQHLAETAASYSTSLCIVTGGEPAMYDLLPLTNALHRKNLQTHLETSAAYTITGNWDWICISPKKFKPPLLENMKLANELKVVVYHSSDLAWAEEFANTVTGQCHLFLQPEWSRASEMQPLITDHILKNPKWNLSLQIHKYLGLR